MTELLNSIKSLIETIHNHKWGTVAAVLIAFSTVTTYVLLIRPPVLSEKTNTNTIPLPVKLAQEIDRTLTTLLEKTEADLVAIGVYRLDPSYEERYITFLRQMTNGHTYPIPNTKYFLAQDNLYDRYLQHKKGQYVIRSFAATHSVLAFSCPIFKATDNELIGYLSIEYTSRDRVQSEESLKTICYKTTHILGKLLANYNLNETNKFQQRELRIASKN
jgi:hypothetical protein